MTGETDSSQLEHAQLAQRIRDAAHTTFGIEELRPAQVEACSALVRGRDVLLVLPTGAGKSLAYQLPAVLIDGPTLVVSPLLALQRDQMDRLSARGDHTQAVRLSSAESEAERQQALADIAAGVEFLFLSPEQLAKPDVLAQVSRLQPTLVAVDEAHCVSTWGHDFRPDYLRLGELLHQVGAPRIIALTATAAPPVRDDIAQRLRLREPEMIVKGLARENIYLGVDRCVTAEEQTRAVVEAALSTAGPGIVYVRKRKIAEAYAEALSGAGLSAAAYHAGLPGRVRDDVHARFSGGRLDVIVATSAFGMGVDKSDIRFVFHAHVSDSPDSYYQEVGRAGRDGDPALGVVFFRPEDLSLARFFAAGAVERADVMKVGAALEGTDVESVDRPALEDQLSLGRRKLANILNLVGEVAGTAEGLDLVEAVVARSEAHRQLQESRIEMMRSYADTGQCRRQFLLGYFGEELPELCGDCDNCLSGDAVNSPSSDTYGLQSRVRHVTFGGGLVMDVNADVVTVLFESVGYRTLHLPTVIDNGLLTEERAS